MFMSVFIATALLLWSSEAGEAVDEVRRMCVG